MKPYKFPLTMKEREVVARQLEGVDPNSPAYRGKLAPGVGVEWKGENAFLAFKTSDADRQFRDAAVLEGNYKGIEFWSSTVEEVKIWREMMKDSSKYAIPRRSVEDMMEEIQAEKQGVKITPIRRLMNEWRIVDVSQFALVNLDASKFKRYRFVGKRGIEAVQQRIVDVPYLLDTKSAMKVVEYFMDADEFSRIPNELNKIDSRQLLEGNLELLNGVGRIMGKRLEEIGNRAEYLIKGSERYILVPRRI